MLSISASLETVPEGGQLRPPNLTDRSLTMKKLAILIAALGFVAAAPLAAASEDGIDLMPNARGIEMTQYVSDAGSSAVTSSDEFYNLGTGGVPAQ
ncbi:MAG: hypothetical protein ACREVS_04265 [Burkholderiales bacterium]